MYINADNRRFDVATKFKTEDMNRVNNFPKSSNIKQTSILSWFSRQMDRKFELSMATINQKIFCNGSMINQEQDGTISIDMEKYLSYIQPLERPRNSRKQYDSPATSYEISAFRRIAGALMWAGKATVPPTSLAGSFIQRQMGRVRAISLI